MKRALVTVAAFALLTGSAFAQATTTTTTTTTTITTEQEAKIKEYVVKEKPATAELPSGVTLEVGATLPQEVTLHEFGPDVGVTQYRYVVVNGRTAVVDPVERKVIRIIETQ